MLGRDHRWFAGLLGLLALCATAILGPSAPAGERPNFVFLVSEDNGHHFVRLFDPQGAAMPHLESLAAQGLVFEHAFSNSPVCSTARSQLATSCYGPRLGIHHHRRAEPVGLPEGLVPHPMALREAGYFTANRAKTDFNFALPAVSRGNEPGVWQMSSKEATWRDRPEGAPFFFMASFAGSHESSLHLRPEQQREQLVTDPASVFVPPYLPDTTLVRETIARSFDRHALVDRWIGEIVGELEEDGLLEDTFVFAFSDHGGAIPGTKGYAYDRGLHVPLVVRVPEHFRHLVPAGWKPDADGITRISGFVQFVDLGPTLARLAGLPDLPGVDGRAFLGAGVTAEEVDARDTSFGFADRFDEKIDFVRSVRIGDFEYVRSYWPQTPDGLHNDYRYRQPAYEEWRRLHREGALDEVHSAFFRPRPAEMLFRLSDDPYETRDLARDPAFASVLATLREKLDAWHSRIPDLGFVPEPVLVAEARGDGARYGAEHAAAIARYRSIADLELVPFEEARERLLEALGAADPVERVWALIVCGAFGESARALVPAARALSVRDSDPPLVLARAAEFLGLLGTAEDDPAAILELALSSCKTEIEATWVLHSAAVLHDRCGRSFPELTLPAPVDRGTAKQRLVYVQN